MGILAVKTGVINLRVADVDQEAPSPKLVRLLGLAVDGLQQAQLHDADV
jgi:hypothetical protein